jgi:hypothetical protein
MSVRPTAAEEAGALLRRLGADRVPHPGGTLLAHLERVHARLALWDARPALRLAGLCHAFYGTDGFPTGLLPLDRRPELASVIGPDAEAIVHFYASCDREATYPHLLEPLFRDRFTGRTYAPDPLACRDFAELTAANELDLARRDPDFRERWGPELLALLTRFRPLLSRPAWRDTLSVLHGS